MFIRKMSKYSSLPGYDPNSQTLYGDEEAHSLPEDDRDWKGNNYISRIMNISL